MVIKNIIDAIKFLYFQGLKFFVEGNRLKTLSAARIDGPSIINLIRAHKAELTEFLSPVKTSGHIPKLVRENDVSFVTSFAQERLWMLGNIIGRCSIIKDDCSNGLVDCSSAVLWFRITCVSMAGLPCAAFSCSMSSLVSRREYVLPSRQLDAHDRSNNKRFRMAWLTVPAGAPHPRPGLSCMAQFFVLRHVWTTNGAVKRNPAISQHKDGGIEHAMRASRD
jgi:hypothetical protein